MDSYHGFELRKMLHFKERSDIIPLCYTLINERFYLKFSRRRRSADMRILEGRMHQDGVDFWVIDGEKRFVISSKRKSGNSIDVETKSFLTLDKNNIKWKGFACIGLAIFVVFAIFMCDLFSEELGNGKFSGMDLLFIYIILATAWFIYFSYIMLYIIKNDSVIRYHTASHAVLNYYKKYQKPPKTLEDISGVDVLYKYCTYTVFPYLLLWFSVSVIAIVLFNNIWVKLILILLFLVIIARCWMENRLFRKIQLVLLLDYPSSETFEVALAGLEKFVEICSLSKLKM